jgi:hypothetical protein
LAPAIVRLCVSRRRNGVRGPYKMTSRFRAGLLEDFDAPWTFCEVPGINTAERVLRHGVIMRKTQLGTQSEHGNRWIERVCSDARPACCSVASS